MAQIQPRQQTLDLLGSPRILSPDIEELENDKPLARGWEKCLDLKTGAIYYTNSITGRKCRGDPSKSSIISLISLEPSKMDCQGILADKPRPTFMAAMTDSTNCVVFRNQGSLKNKEDSFLTSLLGNSAGEAEEAYAHCNQEETGCVNGGFVSTEYLLDLKLNLRTNPSTNSIKEEETFACSRDCSTKIGQASLVLQSRAASPFPVATPFSARDPFITLQQGDKNSKDDITGMDDDDADDDRIKEETMVIGGCPSCLMYMMLRKTDPNCPKCGSSVLLDFPSSKRVKLGPSS